MSFVRGLELTCDAGSFGGFSGIEVVAQNSTQPMLVAITDEGWYTRLPANPISCDGCPPFTLVMKPIVGSDGQPPHGGEGDAEGVSPHDSNL